MMTISFSSIGLIFVFIGLIFIFIGIYLAHYGVYGTGICSNFALVFGIVPFIIGFILFIWALDLFPSPY